MRKSWKRAASALLSAALVLGNVAPLTALAGVDTDALADGEAYLNVNLPDWSDFDAEYTTAVVTGDGQYTVAMEAAQPIQMGDFNALEIKNGEETLGNGSVVTVDEIKVNGEAVTLAGESYTCSADGAGVTTRVNLWNIYNTPTDADGNVGDDFRSISDPADCTACLIPEDALADVTSLEVTFTVSDFGTTVEAGEEAEYVPGEEAGRAYLSINDENWAGEFISDELWITEDGSYTIRAAASAPQNLAQFNALQITEGEKFLGNGTIIVIDEIKIDGEAVELLGDNYVCSVDGNLTDTRVNLYNEWNSPVDEDGVAGADVRAAVDPTTTTAKLWADDYLTAGVSEVEVTFTISGVGTFIADEGAAEEEAEAVAVDKNGVYHAYIGFQSPKYSFRNAWDGDDGYGNGTPEFDQVTGWDEANNEVTLDGTFTDATIEGNGTYTVSASGLDFKYDDWTQDHMNLIFFSTDIPNTTEITFSDVKLKVNGNNVDLATYVVSEDNSCLRVQLQNIWDTDNGIAEIAYYATPVTDLEITFTVSGFDYDNTAATAETTEAAAETATERTAADDAAAVTESGSESGGLSGGAIAGIIAGVVVVGGGAAAAVAGSKKGKKES